jgi:hypothetical protein
MLEEVPSAPRVPQMRLSGQAHHCWIVLGLNLPSLMQAAE